MAMMTPAMIASMATLSWVFTTSNGGQISCDGDVVSDEGQHGSILSDLGLVCDHQWIKSFLAPVFMLGMLFGGPVVGFLSDRYGRRPSLLLSLSIVTVSGTLLPLLPQSLTWHFIWRFLTGVGAGGILVTTFVYLVEWPPAGEVGVSRSWRLVAALGLHLGWNCGQAVLVMSSSLIDDWRHVHWVTHTSGLAVILIVLLMPESVRWMVHHHKLEDARKVIQNIAKVNGREVSEEILASLSPPVHKDDNQSFTRTLKLRLVILCFLWFSANICYYGIHYSASQLHGNLQVNFCLLMIAEILANLFAHLVALPYFGRRWTLIVCLVLCSVVLMMNSLIPSSHTIIRIILTIIGKFSATTNFNSIYFYTCELFPTNLRSSSIGLCSTMGRLGAMVSVGCVQLTWISPHLPSTIMSVPAVLAAVLLLKIPQPETKNCALPDTVNEDHDDIDHL